MGLAQSRSAQFRLAQFGPAKERHLQLVCDGLGAPSIKQLPRRDCQEIFQRPLLLFNRFGSFGQQVPFDA